MTDLKERIDGIVRARVGDYSIDESDNAFSTMMEGIRSDIFTLIESETAHITTQLATALKQNLEYEESVRKLRSELALRVKYADEVRELTKERDSVINDYGILCDIIKATIEEGEEIDVCDWWRRGTRYDLSTVYFTACNQDLIVKKDGMQVRNGMPCSCGGIIMLSEYSELIRETKFDSDVLPAESQKGEIS